MKLELVRLYKEKSSVIGKFMVKDDGGKVLLDCYSLENKDEGLEANKDLRIPADIYKLKRHSPSRFENTLRAITMNAKDEMICVYNDKVPAKRAILIHWGNTDKDTLGCILLGFDKGNNFITSSRNACKELYDILRGKDLSKIELEIRNEF